MKAAAEMDGSRRGSPTAVRSAGHSPPPRPGTTRPFAGAPGDSSLSQRSAASARTDKTPGPMSSGGLPAHRTIQQGSASPGQAGDESAPGGTQGWARTASFADLEELLTTPGQGLLESLAREEHQGPRHGLSRDGYARAQHVLLLHLLEQQSTGLESDLRVEPAQQQQQQQLVHHGQGEPPAHRALSAGALRKQALHSTNMGATSSIRQLAHPPHNSLSTLTDLHGLSPGRAPTPTTPTHNDGSVHGPRTQQAALLLMEEAVAKSLGAEGGGTPPVTGMSAQKQRIAHLREAVAKRLGGEGSPFLAGLESAGAQGATHLQEAMSGRLGGGGGGAPPSAGGSTRDQSIAHLREVASSLLRKEVATLSLHALARERQQQEGLCQGAKPDTSKMGAYPPPSCTSQGWCAIGKMGAYPSPGALGPGTGVHQEALDTGAQTMGIPGALTRLLAPEANDNGQAPALRRPYIAHAMQPSAWSSSAASASEEGPLSHM